MGDWVIGDWFDWVSKRVRVVVGILYAFGVYSGTIRNFFLLLLGSDAFDFSSIPTGCEKNAIFLNLKVFFPLLLPRKLSNYLWSTIFENWENGGNDNHGKKPRDPV